VRAVHLELVSRACHLFIGVASRAVSRAVQIGRVAFLIQGYRGFLKKLLFTLETISGLVEKNSEQYVAPAVVQQLKQRRPGRAALATVLALALRGAQLQSSIATMAVARPQVAVSKDEAPPVGPFASTSTLSTPSQSVSQPAVGGDAASAHATPLGAHAMMAAAVTAAVGTRASTPASAFTSVPGGVDFQRSVDSLSSAPSHRTAATPVPTEEDFNVREAVAARQ
jgi:hypothetical protein